VFKAEPPTAADLLDVPSAQQPGTDNTEVDKAKYREWSAKVCSGVTQIITGRRGNVMQLSQKKDLCACLNLLEGSQDLIFSWDINLYTDPPPMKAPRVPSIKVGSLLGDKTYRECDEPDDDYDEDDLDSIARPEWNLGEVRVVKQLTTPYWYLARYIDLFKFFICLILWP
jgi:hypothetical protein